MEPFIIEVRLAPDTAALLKSFAPSAPIGNQFPPQSPAEQAARMRMQPPQVPMPIQPTPTYVPQPGPTPAAPLGTKPMTGTAPAYMNGSNVQSTVPVAPTYNQPGAPMNSMPPTAAVPARPVPPAGPSTVQPAAVPSNAAPVAGAPAYELEQLARATATLADAGKMQQIQQLFQQFQIQQLTQLPKERYGEYATALRQMGVHI